MECDEIVLVRYSGLVMNIERFIVVDDFRKVGDGFSAVGGVMAMAVPAITDWDMFRSFPPRAVKLVRRKGTSDAWMLDARAREE